MYRENLKKKFEAIGSRLTIRTGTSNQGGNLRLNVAKDRKGEHFTLTIGPDLDESKVIFQCLDMDKDLRQMLLRFEYPNPNPKLKVPVSEKLLVGHDEMHWFVSGVTTATTIREAFAYLRPGAVNVAMGKAKVKSKDWAKRKNKGFIRQGEWFFVPVHFEETSTTVIHRNEPIQRRGGTPHYVQELVRSGGTTVYVFGNKVVTQSEYTQLSKNNPKEASAYRQRSQGAQVLARGKVRHKDHHTIELKGWHEVHLSTEHGSSINAFID